MSRTDDVINVAGHRLSTGGMAEVLASHADVAERAVVGIADELKGQVPLGLVVLKAGAARAEDELQAELVAKMRAELGAIAALRKAVIVTRLPKTRSGRILRATLRRIADGEKVAPPPPIDDPAILGEMKLRWCELASARAARHECAPAATHTASATIWCRRTLICLEVHHV